jgi:chorismate synthase
MAGSTLGTCFTVTTFGESHGPCIGAVVQGCPPGLTLDVALIQKALDRRKPGTSAYTSPRQESDTVQIGSGVFQGKTTGTPILLLIPNEDAKPADYDALQSVFRPGHGDYTYQQKYGIRDPRGGGRASARETAARVAAGAIAAHYLKTRFGIRIRAYVAQIGPIVAEAFDDAFIDQNPLYCPDRTALPLMEKWLKECQQAGDSLGAKVVVEAFNVPGGLGEPVFCKLDAEIAKALMSINAAKAVEIGDGFEVILQKGSQHRDPLTSTGFSSNHSGGILAGISTGQTLRASVAFKPPSSIQSPIQTVDKQGQTVVLSVAGRHDPCVGPRAVPVVEAMMACVLLDAVLQTTDTQLSTNDVGRVVDNLGKTPETPCRG